MYKSVSHLGAVPGGAGDLDLPGALAVAGLALDLADGAAVAAALEDDVARSAGARVAAAVARGAVAAITVDGLGLEAAGLVGVVAALVALGHFDGWWSGGVEVWRSSWNGLSLREARPATGVKNAEKIADDGVVMLDAMNKKTFSWRFCPFLYTTSPFILSCPLTQCCCLACHRHQRPQEASQRGTRHMLAVLETAVP
jgi:hypothetical protein